MSELKFDANGLIPAVVQDYYTKKVLTVAYMNRESLAISIAEKRTCFYSRSRRQLWRKGETCLLYTSFAVPSPGRTIKTPWRC